VKEAQEIVLHLNEGEQVSIIDNINKQLKFDKDEVYPGGKEIIKQIVEKAPIQLPADYYEFLIVFLVLEILAV